MLREASFGIRSTHIKPLSKVDKAAFQAQGQCMQKTDGSAGGNRRRTVAVRGDILRAARISCGWTQRDAALKAGLTDRIVRKAEAGGRLDRSTIAALARVYELPEAALTSGTSREAESSRTARAPNELSVAAAKAKRFMEEAWNDQNLDVLDELLPPTFSFYHESGVVQGRDEMRQRIAGFQKLFDRCRIQIDSVTDFDGFIFIRWTFAFTHTGEWLGLAPTNRRVSFHGTSWVETVNGDLGNAWDYWDVNAVYKMLAEPATGDPAGG